MALSHAATPVPHNRLLARLPAESLARLWPLLERVDTTTRQNLLVAGEPIHAVYFPEIGWSSMLALMADGNSAEVGLIGARAWSVFPCCWAPRPASWRPWCRVPAP